MLKNFLFPCSENNYVPYLINKVSLSFYALVLLAFNFYIGSNVTYISSANSDFDVLYEMHNEERAKYGLQELNVNTALIRSANNKASAMLEANCWSHYCPNGTSPWTFFDDAGYVYVYAGENLAEGFDEPEEVMEAWLNSPTHRDNVLNEKFDEIGIGYAYGNFQGVKNNIIIVVHFGSRQEFRPEPSSPPDVLAGNLVQIIAPKNDAHLNKDSLTIAGVGPQPNLSYTITGNNEMLGSVQAEGVNFTYRPLGNIPEGPLTIQAFAYRGQNGDYVGESNKVNITIDNQKPAFLLETLSLKYITYNENILTAVVTLNTIDDPLLVNAENFSTLFRKVSTDSWEAEIPLSKLRVADSIILYAEDKAGNYVSVETSINELKAQALALEIEIPEVLQTETSSKEFFLKPLWDKITKSDIKFQVNLVFIFFLSCLFIIDYYVLHKSGLTGIVRSKSHLHLSSIFILIIVALLGGFSGSILTGIAT